jgi:shikimate kinase
MLAEVWSCDTRDTDQALAAAVGQSTAEYLRTEGEPAFRRAELAALKVAIEGDAVVATGGGVVTTIEAREVLRAEPTVWLDCGNEELLERVGDSDGDRPLLGDDPRSALVRLRAEREPWYREVSRVRVDASGDPHDVVTRVLEAVGEVAR